MRSQSGRYTIKSGSMMFRRMELNVSALSLKDGQSITYDFKNASTVQNIWNEYEDLRETEPYQRAQETSGIAITPTDEYGTSEENVHYLFHISKKIYDYNRLEKGSVATLIMSIDAKELDKICTVDYQHDSKQEHNVNFITDRDGYILAYPDRFPMQENRCRSRNL
ncbi:MAG: hypothetical protein V8S08_09625 [Lachnoclostridium sp.]